MTKELKVYFRHIKMHILSGLEYKGWWLMCLNVVFNVVTDPIATVLLFSRFGGIGEWTMERILLIYSLAVTSFGLAETFCRGFDTFPWRMIRSGDFDRLLLRPRSLTFQVAGAAFHIHRVARAFTGLAVVIWALNKCGAAVSLYNITVIVLALFGGFFVYTGVFVMTSGLAFFTVKGLDWIYILTNASYQVTRLPIEHMPKFLWGAFTFFMPMLVISYYPAATVCGWGVQAWKGLLALPAGAAFLGFATVFWRIGVRHYKSTGS